MATADDSHHVRTSRPVLEEVLVESPPGAAKVPLQARGRHLPRSPGGASNPSPERPTGNVNLQWPHLDPEFCPHRGRSRRAEGPALYGA